MIVTVLGSGTSQGVPVISCKCNVCTSPDPRDNRLRASIQIEWDNRVIVVDTGPDFRQQMLRNDTQRLDAVLFTHEHKDHIAGLDDVRAFNYLQQQETDVYASLRVQDALKREFAYIFADFKYPGIPKIQLHAIDSQVFTLFGKTIQPIEVLHYKLPVLGFRIDDFAYVTDANAISDAEKAKLKHLKVLILNCLQRTEHISHFNEAQALDLIAELKPQTTYLTHISHLYDSHANIEAKLPENVFAAYDGLKIHV